MFGKTPKNPFGGGGGNTTQDSGITSPSATVSPVFGSGNLQPASQSAVFGASTSKPQSVFGSSAGIGQSGSVSQPGSLFSAPTFSMNNPMLGQNISLPAPSSTQTPHFGTSTQIAPSTGDAFATSKHSSETSSSSLNVFKNQSQVSTTPTVFGSVSKVGVSASNVFGSIKQPTDSSKVLNKSGMLDTTVSPLSNTAKPTMLTAPGLSSSGTPSNVFGSVKTTTGSVVFGSSASSLPSSSLASRGLGSAVQTPTRTVPSVFGDLGKPTTGSQIFSSVQGKSSAVFGGAGQSQTSSSVVFGSTEQIQASTGSRVFGATGQSKAASSSSVFGGTGQSKAASSASIFGGTGQSQTTAGSSVFGGTGQSQTTAGSSVFGGTGQSRGSSPSSVFGGTGMNQTSAGSSIFGGTEQSQTSSSSVFGSTEQSQTSSSSVFGGTEQSQTSSSSSVFCGSWQSQTSASSNVFGGNGQSHTSAGSSVFGGTDQSQTSASSSVFGGTGQSQTSASTSVFGGTGQSQTSASSSVFGGTGQSQTSASSSVFGNTGQSQTSASSSVFGGTGQSKSAAVSSIFGGSGRSQSSSSPSLFGRSAGAVTGSEETSGARQRSTSPSSRRLLSRKPQESSLFKQSIKAATSARESATLQAGHDASAGGDSSAVQQLRGRRRMSQTEVAAKVAIVCKNVPQELNNKENLKRHFGKFGVVTRVFPNPARRTANVHFKNHQMAEKAKLDGKVMRSGVEPMSIYWAAHIPKSDKQGSKSGDVNEEVASMAGTSDISGGRVNFLRRPGQHSPSPTPDRVPVVEAQNTARKRDVTPPPGPRQVIASVKTLTNTQGQTANDFYNILENRDKILREAAGKLKKLDMTKAKVLEGICPDMCPEKERFMREHRRRLSVFEIVPGTDMPGQNPQVDHARAVKEYSRSSADQEMPLPQELRPPAVLTMTMDYLMGHVMDQGRDGHWEDWYDFLWNRTRGIRKDITQQHLCDLATVSLVEKCVRFHIFCAHRLCEEEYMIFDPKINNENMTKCLQTLKELYHDLETKGQICPNEAEFRAYMVLMNLNEGDTVREAQQLRMQVRESSELRFVLDIYSALNSDNYVKFFKLLKRAGFLTACIMHRYFNQVRSKALLIMLKAYAISGHSVNYPLSKMVLQLAFENEDEAGDFCRHHGLTVSAHHVSLGRGSFIEPETPFAQRRAVEVIESKQTCSVGEVVNGGPLEVKPVPKPSSSFDSRGQYIGTQTESHEDEEKPAAVTVARDVTPPPSVAQEQIADQDQVILAAERQNVVFSNEVIKGIAKDLFKEVIDEFILGMSRALFRAVNQYLDKAPPIMEQVTEDVTSSLIRDMCTETIDELRAIEDARKRQEIKQAEEQRKQSEERASHQLCQELITEEVHSQCKDMVQVERKLYESELVDASMNRVSEGLCNELWVEVAISEGEVVCNEVYDIDVVKRRQQLDDAADAVRLLRLRRYLCDWKKCLAVRQRLRRSMLSFPPGPPLTSTNDQLQRLLPASCGVDLDRDTMHLGASSHLTLQPAHLASLTSMRLTWDVFIHLYMTRLREERAWEPFNLVHIVGRTLQNSCKAGAIDWKLCISCLDDASDNRETSLSAWVCAKLRKGSCPRSNSDHTELLSLYSAKLSNGYPLGICIRRISQSIDVEQELEEKRHLLGTMGIILVIDDRSLNPSEALRLASQRLQSTLDAKPERPAVPVLVVSYSVCEMIGVQEAVRQLKLPTLAQSLVSEYRIIDVGWDIENSEAAAQLIDGLKWLAGHRPLSANLKRDTLKNVVENQLARYFFKPVYENLKLRRKQGLLHQSAEMLCHLYNSVVTHLADALSHPDLSEWSTPVPELHQDISYLSNWNRSDHLDMLRRSVMELGLPEPDFATDVDWCSAQRELWLWTAAVVEDTPTPTLFSRIRWLVKKAEEDFEDTCLLGLNTSECKPPALVNLPWTDIITACVDHRLSQIVTTQPSNSEELEVFYREKDLSSFMLPAFWLESDTDIPRKEEPALETSMIQSAKRRYDQIEQEGSISAKSPKTTHSVTSLRPTDPNEQKAKDTLHKLTVSLETTKQENKRYEEFLQRALDGRTMISPLQSPVTAKRRLSISSDQLNRFSLSPLVSSQASFLTPKMHKRHHSLTPTNGTPDFGLKANTDLQVSSAEKSLMKEIDSRSMSPAEGLELLNNSLESEKTANKMFEVKLKSYLLM